MHMLKGMVILSFLADRHAYLHKVYYKDMHDRMEKHIRQLDVLFLTTTPLRKSILPVFLGCRTCGETAPADSFRTE